jgi:hypothetical protein
MNLHEAVCFLTGWNLACVLCYFLAKPLTRRSSDRIGKIYFDPFETMPDTPKDSLLDRCRR